MRVVGIDVGARRLHAVALDDGGAVAGSGVFAAGDLAELTHWTSGADEVAVDAPDRWSTAPHEADQELAPKFRTARCAEIALGRKERIWVPWTTPTRPVVGWIDVGVKVFAALRRAGHAPVEVFPYAVFRVLGGGPLPAKQTLDGARRRIELLEQAGVSGAWLDMWSHDALDAAAAAVVALHRARGTARGVACDDDASDGSAIWLPESPSPAGGLNRPGSS